MVYGVINGSIKPGELIHTTVEMDQNITNNLVVLIVDPVNHVDNLKISGLHNKDVKRTNGVPLLDIVEKQMNIKRWNKM